MLSTASSFFASLSYAQQLLLPTGIAYDSAGNLYIADANRHQVFEATFGGQLVVIAGSGTQGYAGDNGPATSSQMNAPQALAIGSDGTLYIADTGNNVVRAVQNGIITTFVGSSVALRSPNALAVDNSGVLLVCDSGNHRVLRVATGNVTTVAGSGTQGYSGDGAAAAAAELDTPSGIAVSADGRIFIADTHNQRVRAVATNGTITTFAGTGNAGYSGDNGPATAAQLTSPRGLSITPAGVLLIADANNQRLRSVSPQGTITTLAGGVPQGNASDGTNALAAALNTPRSTAVTSFGYPAFADAPNHTVRVLALDGKLYVPAALTTGRSSKVNVATSANATYGQATATVSVTGSIGVPQGAVQLYVNGSAGVTATLSSGTATFLLATMPAGSYSISAAYTGDGLNPSATSSAVTLNVSKAASAVIAQPPAQNGYATLPILLNANVTSTTTGTPTGTVNFTESGNVVATAQLAAGIASGVYLAPAAGTHSIVAAYQGDANFAPSSSPSVTAVVQPLPDFTLASSGSTTQTVAAGSIASYGLVVAPQSGPFTGAVSFSVSGLPKGATASFAPPQAVPGAGSASTTLSVLTQANPIVQRMQSKPALYALLVVPLLFMRRRRSAMILSLLCLFALTACGTRVNEPPSPSAGTYTLTVSATGTNLAGAAVVHTANVTLIVE